jgi:anti-sigma B factor antagonist
MALDHFGIEVKTPGWNGGGSDEPAGERAIMEIAVVGPIDLITSDSLREVLVEALDDGATDIALDITDVELIDASGIGVLVSSAGRARATGGRLVLRHPKSAVKRVLDALELDGVLVVEG